MNKEQPDVLLSDLQAAFETSLDEIEILLAKYPGPYFMRDFSSVDIMYSSRLSRLAANLPVFRGYHLIGNDRYPNINRWFEAIEGRSLRDNKIRYYYSQFSSPQSIWLAPFRKYPNYNRFDRRCKRKPENGSSS